MSDDKQKKQPTHRVSFSRINRDEEGHETLGPAREIGAIWPRDKQGTGIIRLDHTPREDGVYFVRELKAERDGGEGNEPRQSNRGRDQERERE